MPWTEPQHVTAGEASSAQFNDEIVDNLRLLRDASAASGFLSVELSGGPTSGTNELLLTGTLTIPAQPVDTIISASSTWTGMASVGDAAYTMRIRSTNGSGTVRGQQSARANSTSTNPRYPYAINCRGFFLPANTPHVLRATVQQSAGSGTITSFFGSSPIGVLGALVLPDPAIFA